MNSRNKSSSMKIKTIKTHCIESNESLENILDRYIRKLKEKSIIIITSKIISLSQGRVVAKTACSKEDLIKREADAIINTHNNPYGIYLTIKNNILIPSAGIDESNGKNVYILYPKDIQKTALFIWRYLRKKHSLQHIGIIITDSHTTPMRRGVTGIAIGWCGIKPLYSYIGKPDIYRQPLRVTQINLLDALATSGVLVMGEGNEQTPIAIINNAPKIEFIKRPPTKKEEKSVIIPMEEDLYAPLITRANWSKNHHKL